MSYQRIISLVPSLTELLVDLDLKDRLVGRTRFCVHPEPEIDEIPIMGGTKNPLLDKIMEAAPDYILANREENRREDIEQLQENHHVQVTDIATIEDALITIHELGEELGAAEKARELTARIGRLLDKRPDEPPLRTAYFIWRSPWMTVGRDTYIHDVMHHWNLVNVFEDTVRYPRIDPGRLIHKNPELILLSSEPFPFKEKHMDEIREFCPGAHILLVEGEWFSWYGSRMAKSFGPLNTWRKAIG